MGNVAGIVVVPEIDVPGHTASWGQAYPHLIVHCDSIVEGHGLEESVNRVAMHPLKDEVFEVLGGTQRTQHAVWAACIIVQPMVTGAAWSTDLLDEVAELFPSQFLHLGG